MIIAATESPDLTEHAAVVRYLRHNHGVELESDSYRHMMAAGLTLQEVVYFAVQEYYGKKLKLEQDARRREAIYREAYGKFTALQVQKGSVDQGVTDTVIHLARPLVTGKDVLEVGSGNGGFAAQIISHVHSYSFIEPSADAAKHLIARISHVASPRYALVQTSGALADLQDDFDVIYCNDVYEHLHPEDARQLVMACARKLRRGGLLIMIASNKHFGPFDGTERYLGKGVPAAGLHINETSYAELSKQMLEHGFSSVSSPLMPLSWYVRLPDVIQRQRLWPFMFDARFKRWVEGRFRLLAPMLATTSVIVVGER